MTTTEKEFLRSLEQYCATVAAGNMVKFKTRDCAARFKRFFTQLRSSRQSVAKLLVLMERARAEKEFMSRVPNAIRSK